MICTSIQNKNLEEIFSLIEHEDKSLPYIEMAEIRLDRCPLSIDDISALFCSTDVPMVATCRISDVLADLQKNDPDEDPKKLRNQAYQIVEKRLVAAIEAGATYVDLEVEAPSSMGKRIKRACEECGTTLIRSFHDFKGTPSLVELQTVVSDCRHFGAEIVKIVTTATSKEEADITMSLYSEPTPFVDSSKLIAFCMGSAGKQTRLDCLKYGAPYTYAALIAEEAAAPGQWPVAEMMEAVYGGRTFIGLNAETATRIPASKSFAQRAIVAAALAEGESKLSGYAPCGDNESALAVARSFGAEVNVEGDVVSIKGIGAKPGSLSFDELHVGESGLLTRLMIPVLSMVNDKPVTVTGEKTLVKRPLTGAADIMASFGVVLTNAEAKGKEVKDIFVPVHVNGPIIPGKAEISGKSGSQLISGLLMALPLADKTSTVYVTDPKSIPYMFITSDVLKKFGIKIGSEMEGDEEFLETQNWSLCTGITFKVKGCQSYKGVDFSIEGDWSSAANFLVAGAIFGKALLGGLDSSSLQADLTIMDVLAEAGASLSQLDDTKEISIQRAPLFAFDIDANNCPDLFPILAVLAAFCQGESHIKGTGRLANKESDRAKAIIEMLTQMGVNASIQSDVMTIEGHSLQQRLLTGTLLKGGSYTSNHDHRMVMALKVAELGADSPIEIDDTKCVAKSCPTFMELFSQATK